jgi:hypothetical protein
MPYKSEAQRRYFNANREKLEAEGVDVDEWNKSSKGKKLPEKQASVAHIAKQAAERVSLLTEKRATGLLAGGLVGAGIGGAARYLKTKEERDKSYLSEDIMKGGIQGAGAGLGAMLGGGLGALGGLGLMHAKAPPRGAAIRSLIAALPVLGSGLGAYGGYKLTNPVVDRIDASIEDRNRNEEDNEKKAFSFAGARQELSRRLNDAATTAGKSDLVSGLRYHLPKIRLPDSIAGTTLGGLGGLGLAGVRDILSDDEEEDKLRYARYGMLGAAGGFGAGNLIGDRARRYIANNVPAFGYDKYNKSPKSIALAKQLGVKGTGPVDFLKPQSLKQFVNTAILDRPSEAMTRFLATPPKEGGPGLLPVNVAGRIELMRRHMGLPVRPEDAMFRSTGKRWFQPTVSQSIRGKGQGTVLSGGVPGNREHVEFNPKFLQEALVDNATNTTPKASNPQMFAKAISGGMPVREAIKRYGGSAGLGPSGLAGPFADLKGQLNTVPVTRDKKTGNIVANPELNQFKDDPFTGLFARHGKQLNYDDNTARVFDHWDFGLQPREEKLLKLYLQQSPESLDKVVPPEVRRGWDQSGEVDAFGRTFQDGSTRRDHRNALLKRLILNNVIGDGGVVFDQTFSFDPQNKGIGTVKPIYFNPYQPGR